MSTQKQHKYIINIFIFTLIAAALLQAHDAAAQEADAAPPAGLLDGELTPKLRLEAELFAGLQAQSTEPEATSAFELQRAELGSWLLWREGRLGAELRLETIRSAGPDGVLGIDTNSLVARLKRAWGFARLELLDGVQVELRFGLLPDLWIEAVEHEYDLRGLAPTTGEQALLLDTSDGGASAQVHAPGGWATLGVAVTNGEGRNQRELNPGKNTSVVVTGRPLRFTWGGAPAVLALHLGYRDGSTGVARVRDNRLMVAITLRSRYLWAGGEWLRADGLQGREVEAEALGAWANGRLGLPWLGALARLDRRVDDLALDEGARLRWSAGLYADLIAPGWPEVPRRARLLLVAQHDTAEANAGPLPGVPALADVWRGWLILDLSGRFEPR